MISKTPSRIGKMFFLDSKWIEARKSDVKTTFGWWLKWKRENDEVREILGEI